MSRIGRYTRSSCSTGNRPEWTGRWEGSPAISSGLVAAGHVASLIVEQPRGEEAQAAVVADAREAVAAECDGIADEQDGIADEQDGIADERERIADMRERLADERDA